MIVREHAMRSLVMSICLVRPRPRWHGHAFERYTRSAARAISAGRRTCRRCTRRCCWRARSPSRRLAAAAPRRPSDLPASCCIGGGTRVAASEAGVLCCAVPSSAKETYPLIYANESGTRKLVFTSGAKAIGRSGVAYTREPSSDNEATGRCAARSRVSESENTSTPNGFSCLYFGERRAYCYAARRRAPAHTHQRGCRRCRDSIGRR